MGSDHHLVVALLWLHRGNSKLVQEDLIYIILNRLRSRRSLRLNYKIGARNYSELKTKMKIWRKFAMKPKVH
jgi:hypothetical protein